MKTEIKNRLVSLLESGEYKKGNGELYNYSADCHCVLGVLTEMAIEAGAWIPKVRRATSKKVLDLGADYQWVLNEEIREWAGSTEEELESLAEINDVASNWDEIITYIKENL